MTSTASVVFSSVNHITPHVMSGLKNEEDLAKRYSRKTLFQKNDIVFEFTRDPALLHQYYKLRDLENLSVYGVKGSSEETEYDRNGHIMVARIGNFCIGGARINVKTPRKPRLLPLEIGDFRIEEYFPHLHYKQLSYGQACMFALLPEFAGGDVSREMIKRICSKAAALNFSMLFGTCPILNARLYKQGCISIGLKNTEIRYDIELPLYPSLEEIKLYLLSIPLEESFVRQSINTESRKQVEQLEGA